MNIKKIYLIVMFLMFLINVIWSQENSKTDTGNEFSAEYYILIFAAYSFPNQEGLVTKNGIAPVSYKISAIPSGFTSIAGDNGREVGNSYGSPVITAAGGCSFEFPFLRGTSDFTSGNSVSLGLDLLLTPITVDLGLSLTITPLPFLSFQATSGLGSGWTIGSGENSIIGLGLNNDSSGIVDSTPFGGVVYQQSFSGTFMFDLAAILSKPNKWAHVIFSATGSFDYQYFSSAARDEAWGYMGSNQNFNGWSFNTNWILGYLIPDFPIEMIGITFSSGVNIGRIGKYSRVEDGGWGSDFVRMDISLLANWNIADGHSLLFGGVWGNGQIMTKDTLYYENFRNRESTGKSYWSFNAINIVYQFSF